MTLLAGTDSFSRGNCQFLTEKLSVPPIEKMGNCRADDDCRRLKCWEKGEKSRKYDGYMTASEASRHRLSFWNTAS